MTTFGKRLQDLLLENNMTQKELARKLNVNRGSVSNWVTDRRFPDQNMLIKISEEFNVTIDYLIKGKEDKEDIKEAKELYKKYIKLNTKDKHLVDTMLSALLEPKKDK